MPKQLELEFSRIMTEDEAEAWASSPASNNYRVAYRAGRGRHFDWNDNDWLKKALWEPPGRFTYRGFNIEERFRRQKLPNGPIEKLMI